MNTIYRFLELHATHTPEAEAICSPGRKALTYRGLLREVDQVISSLRSAGVEHNDTIAIVLPEGPEMAVTLLAVMCAAVAAPLNPACQAAEYAYYLEDLSAQAVITTYPINDALAQAAKKRELTFFELVCDKNQPAGTLQILCPQKREKVMEIFPKPEDICLTIYTSGTIARPKIVPLTHHNLCYSAVNFQRCLQLTASDRCLNVMPLFHLHSIMNCLINALHSGGSVICAPGFVATHFFIWLVDEKATWYSASPTIHQSILEQAQKHTEALRTHSLRLVRSSSAALPPRVADRLKDIFHIPVIEGYGSSETSALLTSNYLPPFHQKRGSVGIHAGTEVAIMAEDLPEFLSPNVIGEIVGRGDNIFHGYKNNSGANQQAFVNGWFRTGDQGYMDEDGYFYITGRIKEIINRGGEKIAPREIDEALLDHPRVFQAMAFPIPDEKLGEEVGAAVVAKDKQVTEEELKAFLSSRLVYFKVPRRILLIDQIPLGPAGKPQRIGFAEKVGLLQQANAAEMDWLNPQTETETILCKIWREVLDLQSVSTNQSFISLGGDSILAGLLVISIQEHFDIKISLIDIFESPTIIDQARLVDKYKRKQ